MDFVVREIKQSPNHYINFIFLFSAVAYAVRNRILNFNTNYVSIVIAMQCH